MNTYIKNFKNLQKKLAKPNDRLGENICNIKQGSNIPNIPKTILKNEPR